MFTIMDMRKHLVEHATTKGDNSMGRHHDDVKTLMVKTRHSFLAWRRRAPIRSPT
jgi:hypothetical protein